MFYKPGEPHGMRHNPFNALVVPRPIGWISSMDTDGNVNLAPYSFFNALSYTPPHVMFAANGHHEQGGLKDTVHNVETQGEFVVNMVTQELVEAMNATSVPAPHEVDEFAYAGLQTEASKVVRPPRVAGSPVHLECRYVQTTRLRSIAPADNSVVFGEVIGIHIDDRVIENGIVAWNKLRPVGRLGYLDYSPVETITTHPRPKWAEEKRG